MNDLQKIIVSLIFFYMLTKSLNTGNKPDSIEDVEAMITRLVNKLKNSVKDPEKIKEIKKEIDILSDDYYMLNYLHIQNQMGKIKPVDRDPNMRLFKQIQYLKNSVERNPVTYTEGEQKNMHHFIEHFAVHRKQPSYLPKQQFVLNLLGARHSGEVKTIIEEFMRNGGDKKELERIKETFKVGSLEHIYDDREEKMRQIKNLSLRIQELARQLPTQHDIRNGNLNAQGLDNSAALKQFIKRLSQQIKINEGHVVLHNAEIANANGDVIEHFSTNKHELARKIKQRKQIINRRINKLKKYL